MYKKTTAFLTALLLFAGAVPISIPAKAETSSKLDASQFKIHDENLVYLGADYLNSADVLFNQQDYAPESPENTSVSAEIWEQTIKNQNWKPNYQAEFGDDTFFIDLGANYVITGLCFLDTNGVQTWTVQDGEPFSWNEIATFETDWYQAWRGITFENPRETRYLRFSAPAGDSGVSELAIYGYQVSELSNSQKAYDAPSPASLPKTNLSAGQRIGFNAFIDDPMSAMMAGGNIREYHNFNWLYDDNGKIKFTQGTWGDMDSYYSALKARNISVIPCFQAGSTYISGEKPPEIPVPSGADTLDPASYTLHAQAFYQVAARYGSNQNIDISTLNVSDNSEIKTGLNLLNALENSNEPNKTWSGKANFFSPYEQACMCSADYDGHEGTIPNAGVKTADPNFKLAMGGMLNTASFIEYLDQMKLWFSYHRTDKKFAVDIINIHMGADTYNPEDSTFTERVKQIQNWIDNNAPGTELWISEFEVPMADCETDGIDNHDNNLYQLRYAQRVARTYLMSIGAGVDRMTKFQLRDEGEGVYYNSGLTTGKGEWSKKLAWYYTACMTNMLKNADFISDNSTDEVKDYIFKDRITGDEIHCLWSPTSEDKVIQNYVLSAGNFDYAYLTEPGTYAEGVTSRLYFNDGVLRTDGTEENAVSIDVSETPVFVKFSGSEQTVINGKGKYIAPASLEVTETNKPNQFERMFDEPDSMPEFIYSDTGALKTPETNVNASNITGIVKLDKKYILTGFGIFDTYGTGSIEIYDDATNTLLWSNDLGSYMSRNIELTTDSIPVDTLRIVKGGGDFNELAFYGYPAPETSTVEMDVTNDGNFNLLDVVALQKWLLSGKSVANPSVSDVNHDNIVNIYDWILMKKALLKK
ncbi:MAG: hypothetical protein E7496_03235 [Ruminococcus sp.]|nr:hypothetical protein [Ruminococcus sp.]